MLSPLTRLLFSVQDEPLLKFNYDDNRRIEPESYLPIIPMVLVNGAEGKAAVDEDNKGIYLNVSFQYWTFDATMVDVLCVRYRHGLEYQSAQLRPT